MTRNQSAIVWMAVLSAIVLLLSAQVASSSEGAVTEGIQVEGVDFDTDGAVRVFGTASVPLVNVYVKDSGDAQVIDALIVVDGRFDGTFFTGKLSEGIHIIVASGGGYTTSFEFTVSYASLTLETADFVDGTLSYKGSTSSDIVNLWVVGDAFSSAVDVAISHNGGFSGSFFLGDLVDGDYRLVASIPGVKTEKEFAVFSGSSVPEGTELSDDGKTLIKFTGSVSKYSLPRSVEVVSDQAFANCFIGEFVLDRDVYWDIVTFSAFPLQNVRGLDAITVTDGVTCIPDYLFAKTGIKTLHIPASVSSIGIKAVYHCENLESVDVADRSRLTSIGSYAFSSNTSLASLTFGSSADGIECTFSKAAFLADNKLVSVKTDKKFNLVEIGDYAFAKTMPLSNIPWKGVFFNSDSGILVPATVKTIGRAAFSQIQGLSYAATEPQANMISSTSSSVTYGISLDAGSEILFEEGSLLTSISAEAFAFKGRILELDLSKCTHLNNVDRRAFYRSLDPNVTITWSDSIETIGEEAFKVDGPLPADSKATIPASVREVGTYGLGIAKNLVFGQGSKLVKIGTSSADLIDMRNCLNLEIDDSGAKVLLPVGVIDSTRRMYGAADPSTPVAKVEGDTLTIEADTVALVVQMIRINNVSKLVCSPDNPYFKVSDGNLFFIPGDGRDNQMVLSLGNKNSVSLDLDGLNIDSATVRSGALGSSVKELVLGSGVILSTDSLKMCIGLESVTFMYRIADRGEIDAFDGMTGLQFNVMDGSSDDCISLLDSIGDVSIGLDHGTGTVFVPAFYNASRIEYGSGSISEGIFEIPVLSNLPYNLVVFGLGCDARLHDGKLVIDNFGSSISKAVFMTGGTAYEDAEVILHGEGGIADGKTTVLITVGHGLSLNDVDLPAFTRNLYDFVGWVTSDGTEYDGSEQITSSIQLYAKWTSRNPRLDVDRTAVSISVDGAVFNSGLLNTGSHVLKVVSVNPCYEIFKWVINGQEMGDANEECTIDVVNDTSIAVTYRFHSSSSGLDPISNRDLPTPDDVLNLVKACEIGGYLDTTGEVWKGHDSVPLIVDGKIYFRAGSYLYRAESDTGFIDRSVLSVEAGGLGLYYHHLGYGDGVVIDYLSKTAYDLDLNKLYSIDTSISVEGKRVQLSLLGVEYHDGYFYTSGEYVCRFSSGSEDVVSGAKHLDFVGSIPDTYASYGFASSIFVGDHLYRIIVDGSNRGIAALNLDTKVLTRQWLPELRFMLMDDGWISYYDGVIYATAYTEGLFGYVASEGNAKMAYLSVDGGKFGDPKYFEFSQKGFASQFVVANGTGYVNCGDMLYAFDMGSDGMIVESSCRTISSSLGHGSISVDVTHMDEDGSPVYIYMIPYDSYSSSFTLCIIEDIDDGSSRVLTRYAVPNLPQNYNSQTIRPDEDGRMIWYNDSGHIFVYTTSEKNPYYFFIDDGSKAMWYESYGRDPAEALAALGESVVTLGSGSTIGSLSGIVTASPGIWALRNTASTDVMTNLQRYAWTSISSLVDKAVATSHYFLIRADGAAGPISEGTTFNYLDSNGEAKVYSFVNNIGDDRAYLGIRMVLADNDHKATVSFYDEENNLIDKTLGAAGGRIGDAAPAVSKDGKIPVWKKDGTPVDDIREEKFADGSSYHLTWVDAPEEYDVTGTMVTDNGETAVSYTITGKDPAESMILAIYLLCNDGTTQTKEITLDSNSLIGNVTFDTVDAAYCLIKICLSGQSDDIQSSYGFALVMAEAGV